MERDIKPNCAGATERRTSLGIYYKNEALGLTSEYAYPLHYHFYSEPQPIKLGERKGWLVGVAQAYMENQKDRFLFVQEGHPGVVSISSASLQEEFFA
jgi:hypothetical protein